ncbi:zinc-ribbon domain-containing protein [Limnobacter humi]|uniref:Zinc-ribbon domain-containing protein n=1 Tax=Limnobacter humi TaxID=1778671 RepID=A0ABT1WHM0_9BURK|nr:DUF3426 domain-containing protein [Limnobacter humi]MCQ8897010.1 zinc-ribbon domain-containing protein [Limnobacter humi]
MSLATRCPHCNTLFKVTSGQLQIHQGQVRCGHCQQVFSGIDHLTAADADAWQTTHISLPATANPPPPGPEFLTTAPDPKPAIRLTRQQRWASGCLLTLLLLQGLWWSRHGWLQYLPVFQQAGLPAWVIELAASQPGRTLVLEGSGLTALDENTLRVDLTLLNRGPLPVHWPVLKVDLLDPQGLVMASKLIRPAEYEVRQSQSSSASTRPTAEHALPIRVRQTVEVLAYLNTQTLNEQLPDSATTGFRVSLLDPH